MSLNATDDRFVSMLLPVPSSVGETFTYRAGDDVRAGCRVEVVFGRRRVVGYVVGEAPPFDGARDVEKQSIEEPLFTPELIALTRWMSDHYVAPWYRCMETAVPSGLKMKAGAASRKRRVLEAGVSSAEAEKLFADDERVKSMMLMILEHPRALTIADASAKFELGRSRIETLVRKEHLKIAVVDDRRSPFSRGAIARDEPRILNAEQDAALRKILEAGAGSETLIMGVTGSGKTEVYLQAIGATLEEERDAIVLVPEISLTPQTVDRFRARFGETVAVLHSALSAGERFDEWTRIRAGEARVVVGARSAVFAPVARLGLIVIDEAHEAAYKQQESPRYHAIEVARERSRLERARLVLGTATPLCEMAAAAMTQPRQLEIARLTRRIADRPLPETTVVDMRQELADGHRSIFSRPLQKEMRRALANGEQAILFINRRGHDSFILCRSCGEAVKCPLCSVSLTPHGGKAGRAGQLICHFCNHRTVQPEVCPKCGSRAIKSFGAGTEKIEAEARKTFPGARVVRMDADTTVRKGEHRRILEAFASQEFNVLVGTQMIGKGLDLPLVTVIGIVAAESSLHIPDFRAPERTFDLLTQVTGRAGRSDRPGRAIIQTYAPDHYAIRHAARQNVDAFLRAELAIRKASGLPPYSRIIQWTCESPREDSAMNAAGRIAESLRLRPGSISGPAPAPFARLRGRHRWQVRWLFKPEFEEATIREAVAGAAMSSVEGLKIVVDVDPTDMM